MESIFSDSAQKIISYSREEASRLGCNYIGVDHFFLGILREPTGNVGVMLEPIRPYLKDIAISKAVLWRRNQRWHQVPLSMHL